MARSTLFLALLVLAPLAASACGDNDTGNLPDAPTPVSVTETFSETLTVNGGKTHPFVVQQAGAVSAVLTGLSPDAAATIGLSLGTWNGSSCQIVIANDAALLNVSVVGAAQQTGQFCVRVYDVGKLTSSTDYTVQVTHF